MDNSSHVSNGPCPLAVSVFFTTLLAVISLAAFIGNILEMTVVYKTPSLRTSTNFYYVNIAVSDFLSSLTSWPLYFTDEIIISPGILIQGPLATSGCKIGVYVRLVSTSVSILSLLLIATDRYIAIVFPFKTSLLLSRKVRITTLVAVWAVSMSYSFPMLYFSKVEDVSEERFCRFAWNDAVTLIIYYVSGITMINVVPRIVIVILYSRIMQTLRKKIYPGPLFGSINLEGKRNKEMQNIMKIFKSIVIAYTACFFLLCVYLILKMFFPEILTKDKCKWILGFSYFVFPLLSTAIIPIILFLFSSNFRHALQTLWPFRLKNFCCSFCKKRKQEDPVRQDEQVELQILVKNIN